MFRSLYSKLLGWLLLNLLLIVLLGGGFITYLLLGNNGLAPAYLFNPEVDNLFRLISTNLQYHPVLEWRYILERYEKGSTLRIHLVGLDEDGIYFTEEIIPTNVVKIASDLPRIPFTFCAGPVGTIQDNIRNYDDSALTTTLPAIYLRTGDPPTYWYGRTMFVPDMDNKPHYLLMAFQSDSFSGGGLFFNTKAALLVVLAVMIFSCLWWLPFIWHITKPLLRMVSFAEYAATSSIPEDYPENKIVNLYRKDEIGRLGKALTTMNKQLTQKMAGQSQFIQHIAHELNSPIARCKLGLAVLESRLEGDYRQRVQRVMRELDCLTLLTGDVLEFLRAQSSPQPTVCEQVRLQPLLTGLSSEWENSADIRVAIPFDTIVWGDKSCIRRAALNALRNAVLYAGDKGPINVFIQEDLQPGKLRLVVQDSGDGVPEEELALITEPFYRGSSAKIAHPGGSGLGLAIIKSSMERCGGTFRCVNGKPKGFSVIMTFFTGPQEH